MEKIKMSFVSVQRILQIASKAGQLNEYEENTLKYIFAQCSEDERDHLLNKFAENLPFLQNSIAK